MKWKQYFTKEERILIWIAIGMIILAILVIVASLSGCANRDWYLHLRARPELPVDLTIGRGSAHTVQKVTTEDNTD